jgi:hypothetical protein
MQKYYLVVFFSILLQVGFSQSIDPFLWLEGTWEMPRPKGGFRLETWKQNDSNSLIGKGIKVVNVDTTLLESIEIKADNIETWYIPIVPDQNNATSILFKLVSSTDHQFVFENPQHDFPQRITYIFKPVMQRSILVSMPGDTLDVDVTSFEGDGIHYQFTRKK